MISPASARIFISYSRKDGAEAAARLRRELEDNRFLIWQDLVALEGGRDWWSQIEEALRSKALQHFILIVTPGALASPIVRREIWLARQEGKTFLPVKGSGFGDLAALPRWFGHITDLDIAEQRASLLRTLEAPSKSARVPMMAPEPPADFVVRPRELGALKRQLVDAKGDAVHTTVALRGAGGYGKTTLARALAHDPDILDAYFDGILWVELGEKPADLLGVVSDLIALIDGERRAFDTLNAAITALGEAFGDRRMLLVIDDAWRETDLKPLLQGGPNVSRLITTRLDRIVPSHAFRQPVDAMSAEEAIALLSWGLPEPDVRAQEKALRALVQRLGAWAQLLKLVNGFLGWRLHRAGEPLERAVANANRRLDEKGLTAFDVASDGDRSRAVARTISVSLDLLDGAQRERFAELAVLPEDTDVPIGIVARLWHETGRNWVTALAILPDGRLASGSTDARVRLWDLDTGAETARLEGHLPGHLVTALVMLRHGRLASSSADRFGWITGSKDNPVRLWDLANGTETARLGPHIGSIGALAELPDGRLASGSGSTVRLWDPAIGAETAHLKGHVGSVTALVVLPDSRLASGADDWTIHIWDLATGAETARLHHGPWGVTSLAVLPGGRLVSGSKDKTVRLWDLATTTEIVRLEVDAPVNCLAALPDGRLVAGDELGRLHWLELVD